MAKQSFGFLHFMNVLFALFVVIDSIVQFVKVGTNMDDSNSKYIIIIMCFRLLASILLLAVTGIDMRTGVNDTIKIFSSWFYAIFMVILLYLSAIVIKFQWNSLSLIVQLFAAYLGFGVGLKLLISKYVEERDDNIKGQNAVESTCSYVFRVIDGNLLAIGTLLTVVLALTIGILMKEMYPDWNQRSVRYVGFPGEIFLRILKCLILPLIFSSLVFAMGNLDTKLSGKIGLRTVIYYLATTVIAIILGIILVLVIRPGDRGEKEEEDYEPDSNPITTEDTILDLIRNLFPENLIEACFQTFRTSLVEPSNTTSDGSNTTSNDTNKYDWEIKSGYTTGSNILGIVVFAITFGVIIGYMNEEGKVLLEFFRSFNNAMMIMTEMVIQITPIAVLFLVLPQVLNVSSISDLLGSVGWYTLTTIIGLLIHGIIILPGLYLAFTRKNPYSFLSNMSAAIMTAFGTASSSATMPVTFQCIEERNHIDKRISRFCIPVGATINMDGTALYEAVAAIFIAQYNNIDLTFSEVVIISITATAASIGAAGIPQAGLITMVIVLNAVGLPAEYAALIYIVDWLIDRFRTAINVLGDAVGSGIVAHLSQEDLKNFQLPDSLAISSNGINGI